MVVMTGLSKAKVFVELPNGDKIEIDFPAVRCMTQEISAIPKRVTLTISGDQVTTVLTPNPDTPARQAAIRIANNLWKASSLPGESAPEGWVDSVEQEIKAAHISPTAKPAPSCGNVRCYVADGKTHHSIFCDGRPGHGTGRL